MGSMRRTCGKQGEGRQGCLAARGRGEGTKQHQRLLRCQQQLMMMIFAAVGG